MKNIIRVAALCISSALIVGLVFGGSVGQEGSISGASERAIEDTRITYYKLGRDAGVLAILEALAEEQETGRKAPLPEIYKRADAIAEMPELIEAN